VGLQLQRGGGCACHLRGFEPQRPRGDLVAGGDHSTGRSPDDLSDKRLPPSVPETSLVIVGQLGGGLGTTASYAASPTHATQVATWPIAGDSSGATNSPPPQGNRVQSFSTPVAPGTTTSLTWSSLKPGTYLIESGTHPSIQGPMGLYGILVVTTAPTSGTAGCAYPGATAGTCAVNYNAEIPIVLPPRGAARG